MAADHKRMLWIVEKFGSAREYRVLLNLLVTRYEDQMKKTTLRPNGFLEHEEVQRMYKELCTLNDTESRDIAWRICVISKHVISKQRVAVFPN